MKSHSESAFSSVLATMKSHSESAFSGDWQVRGSIIPKGPLLLTFPSTRHLGTPPFIQPKFVTIFSSSFEQTHFVGLHCANILFKSLMLQNFCYEERQSFQCLHFPHKNTF